MNRICWVISRCRSRKNRGDRTVLIAATMLTDQLHDDRRHRLIGLAEIRTREGFIHVLQSQDGFAILLNDLCRQSKVRAPSKKLSLHSRLTERCPRWIGWLESIEVPNQYTPNRNQRLRRWKYIHRGERWSLTRHRRWSMLPGESKSCLRTTGTWRVSRDEFDRCEMTSTKEW